MAEGRDLPAAVANTFPSRPYGTRWFYLVLRPFNDHQTAMPLTDPINDGHPTGFCHNHILLLRTVYSIVSHPFDRLDALYYKDFTQRLAERLEVTCWK